MLWGRGVCVRICACAETGGVCWAFCSTLSIAHLEAALPQNLARLAGQQAPVASCYCNAGFQHMWLFPASMWVLGI